MGTSQSRKNKHNTMNSNNKESSKTPANENASSTRPLSIEAARPSGPMHPVENQPRQPENLQGLLRFAMEATKAEDAPHSTHFTPMDEERKKFLNEAINSLTVNVIEELQKSIKLLRDVMELRPEDDPADYENALEVIAEYIDSTDIANDFYKIGGFSIFGHCLNSPHASIRWKAADIIAELTQNNPFCQDKVLEMGLMPILLGMVDSDPSDQARIKSLYAVSCIVRGNALALKYMDVNDGYAVLMRALQSPIEKLQIKSAFLLSALCNKENAHVIRSKMIKMGLVKQAAELLAMSTALPDTRDRLLDILNSLTLDSNLPALRECRRPELRLKETLERHLLDLNAEEAVDEAQSCAQLLDKIFADQSMNQDR
ncbi:hsp70-binding protein 1 [Fopius arisanus]|uniref:Hsp70-binding protein 1 n=1 Tax=Fopius arisanus TaxID=64838 RepID=A0A9R1TZM3_9HYME|nr:PREDICTED: hsp70-binding protein 1 [Fopius arisanus]XP_011301876.1 PREDICTED: hsp70-binding protein 1 [Fopius arisanus]